MKFITGFGCHQSEKEISSIVFPRPFRFVSFRFLWSPTSAQPSFMSSSSNSWYCWWFFSFLPSSSPCVLCLISLFRMFAFFHVPKQWWLLLEVVVYVDLPHRSEGWPPAPPTNLTHTLHQPVVVGGCRPEFTHVPVLFSTEWPPIFYIGMSTGVVHQDTKDVDDDDMSDAGSGVVVDLK